MRTATLLAITLLAFAPCRADAPGFLFIPGHEYTYNVEIKRQWRTLQGLPNWAGELKVWPMEKRANGAVLIRERLTLNPYWPGVTRSGEIDDTMAWAEFELDLSGKASTLYRFPFRSDVTRPIPLNMALPKPGETKWQESRTNGTTVTYAFAPGSNAAQPRWQIEADFHSPRNDVQRVRFHASSTYDPVARRLLTYDGRGDYEEGVFVWQTITATFSGEREVPPEEFPQIQHDSAILYDVMKESDELADDADDPDDLAAFEQRLDSLGKRLPGIEASLQVPAFREDAREESRLAIPELKQRAEAAAQKRKALVGKPSPDWMANDMFGQPHALKDYRGKVVLLDFWAHTCGPCLMSVPALNKIERDYAGKKFEIISINVGDGPDDMRRAVEKFGMKNTQLAGSWVIQKYGFAGIPMYLLIDQDGVVRARHIGWDDSLDPVLRREIDQLLSAMPQG